MTSLLTTALWPVECSTIVLSRFVCGDETTLDLADGFLTEDHRAVIAERHPRQVNSMLETRAELD